MFHQRRWAVDLHPEQACFLGWPVAPMFAHAEPGVAPAHAPELRLLEKQISLPSSAWVWLCFPLPFPLPALAPFCAAWYGAWFW